MKKLKWGVIIITVLILIGIIAAVAGSGSDVAQFEYTEVTMMDIVEEVSVTGTVEPRLQTDLASLVTGRVSAINTVIGAEVARGKALLSLESADVRAQYNQALAEVNIEEANLAEMERGSRPEELAVQKVKVSSAEIALNEAQKSAADTIIDARVKADDAVTSRTDQFFDYPVSASPDLNILVTDSKLENTLENDRPLIGQTLASWNAYSSASIDLGNISAALHDAKERIVLIKTYIENMALAVNSLRASSNISQTTIDGYRATISTARANISTALTNVTKAEDTVSSAKSAYTLASEELILLEAGTDPLKIQAGQARLAATRAKVQNLSAELGKRTLYAPFAGKVTDITVERGEVVTAGATVISMISDSSLQIEAYIPEVDIATVQVGNIAMVTLDAYRSGTVFMTEVVTIEPAETVIEGVPTYRTVLVFQEADERIRPGMTANIDIVTGERDNVLSVPIRSIITKNRETSVKILIDEEEGLTEERMVETGLRGSDGFIEILSGLSVGDKVITREIE